MTMRLDWPPLPTITPWHAESVGFVFTRISPTSSPVSTVFVQNLRHYVMFEISKPVTVTKVFVMIGATQNGNVDIAIHDAQLNLVQATGSTAMGTANAIQVIDWTDLNLLPGVYFMSVCSDSATGTGFANGASDELVLPMVEVFTQASAFTAPDPAVPIMSSVASPIIFAMGLLIDDTVLS